MPKAKLSPSQVRVLKTLSAGSRYTSRTTHREVVHGGACKSLVKRGLVEVEARTAMGIIYRLTDALTRVIEAAHKEVLRGE